MRRRDHALISRQDPSMIRDLEDQIESMKANIDYVQESIAESQANIMQIEESKVCVEFSYLCNFLYHLGIACTLNINCIAFFSQSQKGNVKNWRVAKGKES